MNCCLSWMGQDSEMSIYSCGVYCAVCDVSPYMDQSGGVNTCTDAPGSVILCLPDHEVWEGA